MNAYAERHSETNVIEVMHILLADPRIQLDATIYTIGISVT